jgi:hypothetical protein
MIFMHLCKQSGWLEDVLEHILQPASYTEHHILIIMKRLEPITNKVSGHNRIAGMLK